MFEDESMENKQNEESVEEPSVSKTNETPVAEPKNDQEAPFVLSTKEPAEEPAVPATEVPAAPATAQEPKNDSSYEYVFSSGRVTPSQKPPKKNRHVGLLVTGICLAVAFCIAFFFALGIIVYQVTQNLNNNGAALPGGTDSQVRPNASVNLDTVDLTVVEHGESEYGSAGEEVFAESQVVRMVHDAVVVIEATVSTQDIFGRSYNSTSSGSGVVITENGYILTCNHVVEGASKVLIRLNDQTEYEAVLVGADSASDLAVLKIEATDLVYASQGRSANLVPGEHVIAIGNPLGTLGGTVTSGIISATERNIPTEDGSYMTLIQTDAAINSGNSGGGLFNLRGELIGIVNAKYASSGVEGLAFAIPVDSAITVEKDLIEYGYVRGVIDDGLKTVDVAESDLSFYRYRYGITKAGLYVAESKYATDLQNKDRIVSINGKAVNTTDEWNAYLKENCKVGDTVTIVYERDGKQATTTLTLQEYVPTTLQ